MDRKEIVRKAIEFDNPPRLPFFTGNFWQERLSSLIPDFPNDVCDCWEMDRQKAGWFFDNPTEDDWGCGWEATEVKNMGQVVYHPLSDWKKLETYQPPNPKDPFYFDRIENVIKDAEDKYIMVSSHFNLLERMQMLRGFENTLMDFYTEPAKVEKNLDMILEFKIAHFKELHRRFGDRINGLFLTDDWGTQDNTFISDEMFKDFFLGRYKILAEAIHSHGWHFILHSDGRINNFIPMFIEAGIDVLNLQQPNVLGLKNFGKQFAGKICFLSNVDIQSTLPEKNIGLIKHEAKDLIRYWSKPKGGFIVFNPEDNSASIGTTDEMIETMFLAFYNLADYWQNSKGQ
jgi:uroporphyrinogen decarboxylase